MLRVAITLAQITMVSRDETRDTLDVRWGGFLSKLGFWALPLIPSAIGHVSKLHHMNIDAIILSGGGDINDGSPRANLERQLLEFSKAKNIPLIGVCRGMQMINCYQNGNLLETERHVGSRHNIVFNQRGKSIEREVNSFHNYCITSDLLGNDLEAIAYAEDNTIECFRHKSYPWLGIMWHPERETPFDELDLTLINQHFGE